MKSGASFSARLIECIAVACFQMCWFFPLSSGILIGDIELGAWVALLGLPLAGVIGFAHSLLVVLPLVYLAGRTVWEQPATYIFSLLLPAHLFSVAVPLTVLALTSSGMQDNKAWILMILFILHAELVLFTFVRRLHRVLDKKAS
jgi:hypothetical protein